MNRFSVVIAGGGVAGLEALLRLHRLARDRVDITLLAPNEEFAYRALAVGEPFSHPSATHHAIEPLVEHADATWVRDSLESVDLDRRALLTGNGQELEFDALLVAVGAQPKKVVAHAKTFDDAHADEMLRGIVQDLEQGHIKKIAFVNPSGPVWPLPLYELALMTAHAGYEAGFDDLEIHLFTAEVRPLPAFGPEVGTAVTELLAEAGVHLHEATEPDVPAHGRILLGFAGLDLDCDRIIAMPRLVGRPIEGLPATEPYGFLPIDHRCVVPGTDRRVFAAGDGIDFPVKHGGAGAAAADVAAAAVAAEAGIDLEVLPFEPELHGKLLTGVGPKYLYARYVDGHPTDSIIADGPTMGTSRKISSAELAPFLERTTSRV